MGRFVKGDVVVVPFPFSDLSAVKRRPALVIAVLNGNDLILCQITSKNVADSYAIPIVKSDFMNGSLPQNSNVRPNRLFTAESSIIIRKAGTLNTFKLQEVITKVVQIVSS